MVHSSLKPVIAWESMFFDAGLNCKGYKSWASTKSSLMIGIDNNIMAHSTNEASNVTMIKIRKIGWFRTEMNSKSDLWLGKFLMEWLVPFMANPFLKVREFRNRSSG